MKAALLKRINDIRTRRSTTQVIVLVVFSIVTLAGCAYRKDPTMSWREPISSWQDHTILPNSDSTAALNTRANNVTDSQSDRALAVFTLFARHIRSGSSAADVHRVFTNTAWLSDTKLHSVRDLAGWIPVEWTFEDTVFCLRLFPADTNTEANQWVIYFRLSGQVRDEEAIEFLKGKVTAGNPKLIEFALCYPRSTKPGRYMGRIERFSTRGTHVYEELNQLGI